VCVEVGVGVLVGVGEGVEVAVCVGWRVGTGTTVRVASKAIVGETIDSCLTCPAPIAGVTLASICVLPVQAEMRKTNPIAIANVISPRFDGFEPGTLLTFAFVCSLSVMGVLSD